MIQIISNRGGHFGNWKIDKVSKLSEPMTFDMYEINIIDLCDSTIWREKEGKPASINCINDFVSLSKLISDFQKSKLIIAFPQNETLYYNYWPSDKKYHNECCLKDMLESLKNGILGKLIPASINRYSLKYENSVSRINGTEYASAFCFGTGDKARYTAIGSNNPTVIELNERVCLAAIDFLESEAKMKNFLLDAGFLPKSRSIYPEWLCSMPMFNDKELVAGVAVCESEIQRLYEKKEEYGRRLIENLEYKSILCTNGLELVRDVFRILQQILACDLSKFIDEKKEDFRIELDSVVLIGEIKGVTSNIKSEHISQVDVHVQGYYDEAQEKGLTKAAKAILIMNPFRNKPLDDREPIHEIQLRLAKRNDCLIIETITLLRIFEKFRNKELTVEQIVDKIIHTSGLLRISDFESEGGVECEN